MASGHQVLGRKRKRFFFELYNTNLQIRPTSPACKKAYSVFADLYKAVLDWVPGFQPASPQPLCLTSVSTQSRRRVDSPTKVVDVGRASDSALLPDDSNRRSSFYQKERSGQPKKKVTFQLPEDHSDKRERDSNAWEPPWFRLNSPSKPFDPLGAPHTKKQTPKKHPLEKRRRSWPSSPGHGTTSVAAIPSPAETCQKNPKQAGGSRLSKASLLLRHSTPAVPRRQLRFTRSSRPQPSPQGKAMKHSTLSNSTDVSHPALVADPPKDQAHVECEKLYTQAYLAYQMSRARSVGEKWAQMLQTGMSLGDIPCRQADTEFNEARELVLQRYPASALEDLQETAKKEWESFKAARIQDSLKETAQYLPI